MGFESDLAMGAVAACVAPPPVIQVPVLAVDSDRTASTVTINVV
jgi:hypothetical protein